MGLKSVGPSRRLPPKSPLSPSLVGRVTTCSSLPRTCLGGRVLMLRLVTRPSMCTLSMMLSIPTRPVDAPFRMPVSANLKIKGVGNVICGRIEQGTLKPGQEVKFMPTHTAANSCLGKVFTIEMHHKNVPQAIPGDNIG